MTSNIVDMHVRLLNEGIATVKRIKGISLGAGNYQILRPVEYDAEDEEWEFLPGDIVRCESVAEGWDEPLCLAVEKIS